MTMPSSKGRPVRRELRWGLGLCLVLSAIALIWLPEPKTPTSVAGGAGRAEAPGAAWDPRLDANFGAARPGNPAGVRESTTVAALPRRVERRPFAPTEVDLFSAASTPSALAQPAPPPLAVPSELVGPPVPPSPPPHNARFSGRFRTPQGETQIYLRDGAQNLVLARPGTVLASGYVVEALVPDERLPTEIGAVQLIYPPLRYRETLRVPGVGAP